MAGISRLPSHACRLDGCSNVLPILVLAALRPAYKAKVGEFATAFYAVPAIEFPAGAANLARPGLTMRDGLGETPIPEYDGQA